MRGLVVVFAVASNLVLPARAVRELSHTEIPRFWTDAVGPAVSTFGGGVMDSALDVTDATIGMTDQAADLVGEEVQSACQVDTAEFGTVSRWLSVEPRFKAERAAQDWLSPESWSAWNTGDTEALRAKFNFDPFVLREKAQYDGRVMAQIVSAQGTFEGNVFMPSHMPSDVCYTIFSTHCDEKGLQFKSEKRCGDQPVITDEAYFGSSNEKQTLCPMAARRNFPFSRHGQAQDVYVMGTDGQWQQVQGGNCLKISVLDPTKGITLSELDGDLMGWGTDYLTNNGTQLGALLGGVVDSLKDLKDTAKTQVVEGFKDVQEMIEARRNLSLGNVSAEEMEIAVNKTRKWATRLTKASVVPTCLCCDEEWTYSTGKLADHCLVAYTLGGQNKSDTLTYNLKVTAGTLFNLVRMAGNWFVPFIGGQLVSKAHEQSCQFTCDMRQPLSYEPYKWGQVQSVPGVALQTWWIPSPS